MMLSADNIFLIIFLTIAIAIVAGVLAIFFSVPGWILRAVAWAFVLGIVGFVAGMFGPPLLLADARSSAGWYGVVAAALAPVVGFVLGAGSGAIHLTTGENLIALAVAAVLVTIITLYYATDDFRDAAWLVDAEIVSCEQAAKYAARAARKPRDRRHFGIDFADPRAQQWVAEGIGQRPGVVLTLKIYQSARIMERRWRWGAGSQRRNAWEPLNEHREAFADFPGNLSLACRNFTVGQRKVVALEWEQADSSASRLPAQLGMHVLRPVPVAHKNYLPTAKAPAETLEPPLDRSE